MYEVIRPLAAGHQGVVHLARTADGRLVATKRLAVGGTAAEREVAHRRLRREAEMLAALDVDGVVPLLDVVVDGDDLVLVMPYLEGGSLHQRVATAGPIPAHRLAELADPLLRTLAALHRRGVIHRDIKPGNILFDADVAGRPWLVDFGIGTARDLTAGLSAADHLLGTPAFIAPERARGEAATPASDVYSLGATLRFALTGMPPHGIGDLTAVAGRAARAEVEPLPPGTDPRLVDVLDGMCALDPADRPTAADLAPGPEGTLVAAGPFRVGALATATAAGRPTSPAAGRAWTRRARTLAGALVLVSVGLVAGVAAADRFGADSAAEAAPTATDADGPDTADGTDPTGDAATTTTTAAEPTTTTSACEDLHYQPCGQAQPAAGTDGVACLPDLYDHDQDPTNGCEAEADDVDQSTLRSGAIEGTIIPVGDGDTILVPVTDRWQLFCDATFRLTLTAPDGLDLEMRVFDDGSQIGVLEVPGGSRETLRLREPDCGSNDSTTLEVIIRATNGRSSDPWRLERSGSW